MAQQGFHLRTDSQDKVDILVAWCSANGIIIHPDIKIVWNQPPPVRTTQITKRTVTPLVDYSDDESYDDNDDENKTTSMENDGRKPDYEPRGGDEPELVPTAPGLAILARSFIECGTTVVRIPPRAVLSYPNVFGLTLTEDAPQLNTVGSTTSTITNLRQREEVCPADADYERSAGDISFSWRSVDQAHWLSNRGHINIRESGDASLALSFALLSEVVKEEASRWWGYLQSLPVEEPSLAIFWNELDLAFDVHDSTACVSGVDGEHARWDLHRLARRRIAGTQLERYLQSPEIRRQIAAIQAFFVRVVDPFLQVLERKKEQAPPQQGASTSTASSRWAMFRWAYSLVSSRAFWVDAYHGLALVPIADVFNHAEEHHVHLETDWEVCRICGALNVCPHDEDVPHRGEHGGVGVETSSDLSVNPIQHSFDMVCDRKVHRGSEVFNTYNVEPRSQGVGVSSGISNVELMCRYGFVLEGNGADRLPFDEREVQLASAHVLPAGIPVKNMNGKRSFRGVSEIRALFVDAGLVGLDNSEEDSLEMDAEGSISTGLWTRLAEEALSETGASGGDDEDSLNDGVARALIRGVCARVVRLCEGRLEAMAYDEIEEEEGERQGEGLLTVVGRYVRGERALLNAAVQQWRTFGDSGVSLCF